MNLTPIGHIYRFLAIGLCFAVQSTLARADEKGRALLLGAESALKKARSVQAEIVDEGTTTFRATRSGCFSASVGDMVLTCDGSQVLQRDEANKTCSQLDAGSLFEMGNVIPSFFLMVAYLEPGLLPQMESPTYAGLVKLNGKSFQTVKSPATSERGAWTLYFDSTGMLAGVAAEAFHSNGTDAPTQQAWLRNIRLNLPLKEGDFKCSTPAGFQMAKSDNPVNDLLSVHSPAPAFAMPTVDGKVATLDSILKGKKAVLLTITFAECGACIAEVPALTRLHAGLKDKGLAILAVNIVDTRQAAQKVIDKYHLPYPMGLDSKAGGGFDYVAGRYRATAGGLNILIGPDKRIVWEEAGLNEKHLRCVLERMGIAAVNR